jgi:glycosyltransferase involved in cell wall biosynthesis
VIATIIPAYNEPPDRVLAAVTSAAAVSDLVVVADDGSRMPVGIKHDRLTIVRHSNKGPAAAMNLGADEAIRQGATTICRLDVGDRFLEEPKRRQLALTDAHRAVCSWHVDLVESKPFQPLPHWQRAIYWDGAFCIDTIAVSADLWREVGGFDESLRYGDDWDFTMRVHVIEPWHMFPEATCEAGAFPGGHTKGADADPIKKALKHDCLVRCLELGKRLRRPQ